MTTSSGKIYTYFPSRILNLEEIASLISILNPLMDEQQSFSRHVTPTTICGEKNRSALGVESETPEMTGSIPLCIMVHGMGGSDAWSLLFSRSFAVFFPVVLSSVFPLALLLDVSFAFFQ